MKTHTRIGILTVCFFIFLNHSNSQNLKKDFKSIYGLNNKLYNGYVYNANYGSKVNGNAFLYDHFANGYLVLENKAFDNLLLNYDIYNQLLILKFNSSTGAEMMIEVPFFKMKTFSIEENNFKIIPQSDSTYQVFQIIGESNAQFWITHQKKLEVETVSQQYEYQFTRVFTKVYFKEDNQKLIELKKNKSIISLIDKEAQQALKKWLRKNKIKIQKTNPKELLLLSQYINEL